MELNKSLTREDGRRIWRHFQRFAEYNDLKELYGKCIPQIAKFEQKIINFADQAEKVSHIVLKFDKDLVTRVEKSAFNQLKTEMEEFMKTTNEKLDFDDKINATCHNNSKKSEELFNQSIKKV